jgi:hypothetical protein
VNTRELGGLPLTDGGTFPRGVLVRSSALSGLPPEGWAAVEAHGVRTVLDLRDEREAVEAPVDAPPGITYHRVTVTRDAHAAEASYFAAEPDWDANYRSVIDGDRERIALAVSTVAGAATGGIAVHCRVGRDRTGMLVALMLDVCGVPREVIREDFALSADALSPLYDALLDGETDPAVRLRLTRQRVTPPETIARALAHIDTAHGGPAAYLAGAGVDVDRLRSRLLGSDRV